MQSPRLNLPHPFPGNTEPPPNLLQRLGLAVIQPEPHPYHRLLPRIQRSDQLPQILLEHAHIRKLLGLLVELILQRILHPKGFFGLGGPAPRRATGSPGSLLQRGFDGGRPEGTLAEEPDSVLLETHLGCDFLNGRIAAQFVFEINFSTDHVGHLIVHVHWETDGPALISDATEYPLLDPPGSVRREPKPAFRIEFLARLGQSHGTLLTQILEGDTTVSVPFCDGYN
mmetsp:Transcript_39347/g.39861  ORF Transcript_39347/g.39861 Transcript_39347/m.39861 type:complete len:227 (-) Transcript_39347:67-747(-)